MICAVALGNPWQYSRFPFFCGNRIQPKKEEAMGTDTVINSP